MNKPIFFFLLSCSFSISAMPVVEERSRIPNDGERVYQHNSGTFAHDRVEASHDQHRESLLCQAGFLDDLADDEYAYEKSNEDSMSSGP